MFIENRVRVGSFALLASLPWTVAALAPEQANTGPVVAAQDEDSLARAEDSRSISGHISVDRFHVRANEVCTASSDTVLEVREQVVIEGVLRGDATASGSDSKGISIHIFCSGLVHVAGDLIGGTGADAYDGPTTLENCILEGGDGGDITISAPLILVDGRVVAGAGGRSGPNATAPAGGHLYTQGTALTTRSEPRRPDEDPWEYRDRLRQPGGYGLFGGSAGGHLAPRSFTPTIPAGGGGRGGGVTCEGFPVVPRVDGRRLALVLFDRYTSTGTDASRSEPGLLVRAEECPNGQPVPGPIPGFGADGSTGSPGAHGTQQSPQGQTGGPGGHADPVSSTATAPEGNNAPQDCCDPQLTGGSGGKGGKGQDMTGGKGGAGGQGGNGLWDAENGVYDAPGGDGGKGGNGGHASAGNGGQGGDGSKHRGPAGAGGDEGIGKGGEKGVGGEPGMGDPDTAEPGDPGTYKGTGYDGNPGGGGNPGGDCPEEEE